MLTLIIDVGRKYICFIMFWKNYITHRSCFFWILCDADIRSWKAHIGRVETSVKVILLPNNFFCQLYDLCDASANILKFQPSV